MTKWDLFKECKIASTYKNQYNALYKEIKGSKSHGHLNI